MEPVGEGTAAKVKLKRCQVLFQVWILHYGTEAVHCSAYICSLQLQWFVIFVTM